MPCQTGEDELSEQDKKYLEFGRLFEELFIRQGHNENRSMEETLDLGWKIAALSPKEELIRVTEEQIQKYCPQNQEGKKECPID